jgi:hypothetical protein
MFEPLDLPIQFNLVKTPIIKDVELHEISNFA